MIRPNKSDVSHSELLDDWEQILDAGKYSTVGFDSDGIRYVDGWEIRTVGSEKYVWCRSSNAWFRLGAPASELKMDDDEEGCRP